VSSLLCDSGLLIATVNARDTHHAACVRLLSSWPGQLVIPEPVLGETCNFLRNNVRNGPSLEAGFLNVVVGEEATSMSSTPLTAIVDAPPN